MRKNVSFRQNSVPHTKINPKWITDLSVTHDVITLSDKKKKSEILCDLELSRAFLGMTLKAYPPKMDKLDVIKSENVCSENYSGKRIERKATD